MKKIQRDEELMNRLTGIWEEKWSKAQKMMEVSCAISLIIFRDRWPNFASNIK